MGKKIIKMQKKTCEGFRAMYNTHHMSETPKKRGRKKGSTSFTKIRLKDLSNRLRDVGMTNQATVVVSKRWLEDVIEAQEALTIDPVPAKTEETEERIEFTVNTFD